MSSPLAPPPGETPEQRQARLGAAYAVQARIDAQRQAELDAQAQARAASLPGPLPAPLPVQAAPTGGLSDAVQPMAQPVGGLTAAQPAFGDYDDYTGRMGPDGEPERYSTMLGGDPRIKQQREIEERARRLQEPFNIDNWLKSAGKDVRGTTAASQITLQPGTQYQIRDYSGKNDGQVIASGSTPEEFLMLQDVARGLARQGTNADYRIEQVGGTPTGGLAQYRDPTTGEAVTLLGGDLYNKPIAGDIIKIALPVALSLIPGVGAGLSAGLAAKGSLAAKMIGAGLASGIGRTAAGVLTGDPVLDSLKAGAISGLGSAATAGLLDKIGVDKALSGASGAKGAAVGTNFSPVPGAGGMTRIPVDALANLKSSVIPASAFSGLAPSATAPIVVTGVRNAVTPALSQLVSGAAAGGFDQFLSDNAGMVGDEPELLAEADRIKRFEAEAAAAAAAGAAVPTGALSAAESTLEPEAVAEAERIKRFEAEAAAAAAAGGAAPTGALSAAESTLEPEAVAEADRIKRFEAEAAAAAAAGGALPAAVAGEDPLITVTNQPPPKVDFTGGLATIPASVLLSQSPTTVTDTGTPPGDKKTDLSKKIGAGAGVLTLLDQLLGGGGGGGGGGGINSTAGTRASLSPIFSAKLPEARGIFSPASFAPRDMSGTDFARYGYGPAKSFFENVPRNVEEYKAALAANRAPPPVPTGTAQPGLTISSTGQPTPGVVNPQFAGATTVAAAIRRLAPDATDEQIDAYLSGPEGARFLEIMTESGITQRRARGGMMAAKGGASKARDTYAVRGPGTGRSDEIPALLSDGEYVIDAETVSMLGDGSGEAGAKRLDELRIKIRKHKGRNLAKGKFSANAKRPDKYLSGGRV